MTPRILASLLIFSTLLFLGCGSMATMNPINPPSVHASGVIPNCDASGTCAATINHAWGYCQWNTYQTAKTFVVALEVGMTTNNPPNDLSICTMPFAFGGGLITSITGNTNYISWTANVGSAFFDVRSCTIANCDFPDHQEHLIAHKYTVKGAPQSIPFHVTFPSAIQSQGIMVVLNDDLANAKPTTLNVSFSGTFQ